jgi:glycine/D-amino acid oxidase-like deaminating enzyme
MPHTTQQIYDVAVIGAGIIGLTTAFELLQRGRKVVVIDAQEPMRGCSQGNAGYLAESNIFPPVSAGTLRKVPSMLLARDGPLVISPTYFPSLIPWGLRLARSMRPQAEQYVREKLSSLTTRAVDSYAPILRQVGATEMLDRKGGLVVCMHEETLRSRSQTVPLLLQHGVEAAVLGREETLALEPALNKGIAGGVFYPNSARCINPARLGLTIGSYIFSKGAQFFRSSVRRLAPGALTPVGATPVWAIDTDAGSLRAMQVIVCAGRKSDELLSPLGVRSHLASERGYHLMLPQTNVRLNRPVVFAEPFFAATPMEEGLRLAGTAEFAHADKPMNPKRADMLFGLATPYLPNLSNRDARRWMGVRPTTPDGMPYLGEASGPKGLFYSFGHGHIGLTTAAVCAQAMAKVMSAEVPDIDIPAFNVARFN